MVFVRIKSGVVAGIGAGSAPTAPALRSGYPPAIVGQPVDGSNWLLDVGEYTNTVDQFEIAVVSTLGDIILARQIVTGDTQVTLNNTGGKTLYLDVWANNANGTTYTRSAAFGPIAVPVFTEFQGYAFSPSASYSGTRSWTAVAPTDVYTDAKGYGFEGITATTAQSSAQDPRLSGRFTNNATTVWFRIKIAGTGARTVRIWAAGGRGAAAAVTPNWQIYDGAPGVLAPLSSVLTGSNIASNHVVDATGADVTATQWLSVDPSDVAAGAYIDVVVTTGYITVRKHTTGPTATQMNCIAYARVS